MKKISLFLRSESGATSIEYGLIAGAIGIGIIASVKTVGESTSTTFSSISTKLGENNTIK